MKAIINSFYLPFRFVAPAKLFKASLALVALVVLLLSTGCSSDGHSAESPAEDSFVATSSDIDFGPCQEFAGGIAVSKTAVEANVPADVSVLSLTDFGADFEGSDDLSVLVVRAVRCESITVTAEDGTIEEEEDIIWMHTGVPFHAEGWPASQFSYDGVNGADFNNYTINYTTDSSALLNAFSRSGFQRIDFNDNLTYETIDLDESLCGNTMIITNFGSDGDFAFSMSGIVPEINAECADVGIDEIANWWVKDEENNVAANSNISEGLVLKFLDGNTADIFIVTKSETEINAIIGSNVSRLTSFAIAGYMRQSFDVDMIIGPVGVLGQ